MLKILRNLSKKEVMLALVVVILTCIQTYFDLTLPDYMSKITMLVQQHSSEMSEILSAGFKMMGCAFGSLALALLIAVIASKIASNFSYRTRAKVFDKVMNFSMNEINNFSTSSLIVRTTNDITQVQMLIVIGMQLLIKAPITAVWAIIKIANKNISWTTVTGIAVVVLLIIVSICLSLAIPRFKKLQKITDQINRVTRENLDGLGVVRAYNAQEYQYAKFEKENEELTSTMIFTAKTMSFLMPSIQMIINGVVLAVYLVGAVMINEAVGMEQMKLFSEMIVFSSYAMQVIFSFMMLVMVFMNFPRASVSAKRINEVMETPFSIVDGELTDGKPVSEGKVEFKNVSFKYPDADDYAIKDINFTANKGDVVAIIGSTGCGKSTLINLIPRFYDVTEGAVLVDGVNVKEYSSEDLMNRIGYVSQKAVLFSGSIESNVAYGNEDKLTKERLENAVETAQANDFVKGMENSYKGYVAQGGRNLSGGQKQRISIARAIFKNPEILIFDDSFSALDYKTDRALRKQLKMSCADSTRIIVGQRIGTIKDADCIIVLEHGEVVGMGKHHELLKECEVYQQIALSQLSEEELSK